MSKTYLETISDNVKVAKEQWKRFEERYKQVEEFKGKFHLRPTAKSVTIVSTISEKPMRGKRIGKTRVGNYLGELYELMTSDIQQTLKIEKLTEMGFQDKKKSRVKLAEEYNQAEMIRKMSENQSLKAFLKVERLYFIASEFVLHEKQDKEKGSNARIIDIIAYDGGRRLFFFELKTSNVSRGTAEEQVKDYVDYYGGVKRQDMIKVLREYPIISVDIEDFDIEGYGVYGYDNKVDVELSTLYTFGSAGTIEFINK